MTNHPSFCYRNWEPLVAGKLSCHYSITSYNWRFIVTCLNWMMMSCHIIHGEMTIRSQPPQSVCRHVTFENRYHDCKIPWHLNNHVIGIVYSRLTYVKVGKLRLQQVDLLEQNSTKISIFAKRFSCKWRKVVGWNGDRSCQMNISCNVRLITF